MATKLFVLTQPDGGIVNTAFTQQPVIQALNANGTLDTSYVGTVTVAVKYGVDSISGTATAVAIAGVATFTNLKIPTTAGRYVLEFTDAITPLTAVRSGAMTVMNAATTASTVLQFTAASSNNVACGSAAGLDNLTAADMTLYVRAFRTSNANNQFFITKDKTFAEGWFMDFVTDNGNGTVQCGTKYSTTDAASFANSSNLVAASTWYDIFGVWAIASKTWKIYAKPTGTPIAEVSGYTPANVAGVGTRVDDAAATVYLGNLEAGGLSLAMGGSLAWAGIFSKALTLQQMEQVRMGADRKNATHITNVGSCVGLWQLNTTSPITDLSGNSNTGTVTGATTTTGETVYAPTVWGEGLNATDQTTYLYPGSHAKLKFTTDATSVIVAAERVNLPVPTNDNQAAIAFEVNSVYDSQFAVSTITKLYGTRSLPAGAKNLNIINSASQRVGSVTTSNVGGLGVGVVSLRFNSAATEVIPATPSSTIVVLTDSIFDGFLASPVGVNGCCDQLRTYYNGSPQVVFNSFGGASLYGLGVDSTKRASLVSAVAACGPTSVFIQYGIVDAYDSNGWWSATSFGSAYSDLLNKLCNELPQAKIYACTPVTYDLGETANSFGDALPSYRTQIINAVASNTSATLVTGPTQVWDGTNASSDSIHPNNSGSTAIYNNLKTLFAGTASGGLYASYYYSRVVAEIGA